METAGRVVEVRNGRATLACDSPAGCGACGSTGGCGLRWISAAGRRTIEVAADADGFRPLECGEPVTISVSEGHLLRLATRMYLPPLAGLIVGPLVARIAALEGEGVALLAAACGLILGWLAARAWVRSSPPELVVTRAHAVDHGR